MKNTLQYIVSQIADVKDKVEIDEKEENGIVNYTIHIADEDIGKVIGKEGKVIRAIRNVMKIKAIKQNKRIQIFLAEN